MTTFWQSCLSAVGACALLAPIAAGGDLNPPAGPPAPTMKTLVQVEPRAPIDLLPGDATSSHIISQPGAYYLTGNLTGEAGKSGIVVAASNVDIDLNGFTLQGVVGSVDGVRPSGTHQNVAVHNGFVVGWGGAGVTAVATGMMMSSSMSTSRFQALTLTANAEFGLRVVSGAIVHGCIARQNTGGGFSLGNGGGEADHCVALQNSGPGFFCAENWSLSNCASLQNTGAGMQMINGTSSIVGCTINNNAGGITGANQTLIKDCVLQNNSTPVIEIVFACVITGNTLGGSLGGVTAIRGVNIGGQNGGSRIEGNNICGFFDVGIDLLNNGGNFIYRNTLRNNTVNMNLAVSNSAPVSSDAATAGPWHNIALP